MLTYEITSDLTKKLKNVSDVAAEKLAFLTTLSDDCKDFIKRNARVSNIGSSTRIENAILTDIEIGWIDDKLRADAKPTAFIKEKRYIENKLSKDKERSIEEVAGCRNILEIIFQQAEDLFPLSQNAICGLHRELLRFYTHAHYHLGKYKTAPNNVIEKTTIKGREIIRDVFKTAEPGPITESAMHELIEWYNKILPTHPWVLAVASEFVYRFLAIHPFQDGNGRLARGLFMLSMLHSNDKILRMIMPFIAIDRHIEKYKLEYYVVLQKCSGGRFSPDSHHYDMKYFLNFMLKTMNESIASDIDYYANKHKLFIELADAPRKVLDCFKEYPEKRLALKDVLALSQFSRRAVIYAINDLVKKGFLQKYGKTPSTKYQLVF